MSDFNKILEQLQKLTGRVESAISKAAVTGEPVQQAPVTKARPCKADRVMAIRAKIRKK